jgi:hypothetical protein
MTQVIEPEVLNGRRAFADAQALFAGEPLTATPSEIEIGWHDTSTHPEMGSFAVVARDSALEDWIGEVVLISANGRACFVYVMAAVDVPTPLSLARRAFGSLAALSVESMLAVAQVIG